MFCFCVLVVASYQNAFAEDPRPRTTQIEQVITDLINEKGIPGLSIAVATNNQPIYAKGFGLMDVENLVPVNSETKFRTASIAKSLTATAVLALAEDAVIDLDAEVQTYCVDYPKKQWPLTSRQLLGHLGGVRHYQQKGESTSTKHFFSSKAALATFHDDPLLHKPGTKYRYSTFGYNLLGSVIEGASGKPFIRVLQQKVLSPAGMTQTVIDSQYSLITGRSQGYIRPSAARLKLLPKGHDLVAGQLYNAPLHDTSMKVPAGGLLSTASDLVRFAIALNTGKLLGDETRNEMWTSQKTTDGKQTGYGLGLRVARHANRKVVYHTGGQSGTTTALVLFPETGTAVAIMCNLQHASLRTTALQIADLVQPPPPETDYVAAIRKLQGAIRREVRHKELPSFAISLVDHDRTVWAKGFGFQDQEKRVPATPNTIYRVGSISKLFTDIAVMRQVEAGKLDLNEPVETYLPKFAVNNDSGTKITLDQLMSHRSGLVRESPVGNYFDPTEPTLAATIESLGETSLVYPPETKTKYSNAAVAVVGAVLEKSLGGSHADQVKTTILDPLEMRESSFELSDTVREKLATGWMWTHDGRQFVAPEFLLGTGPAGNMYSSVSDLSKFLTCMFDQGATKNGHVISAATYRRMTTPRRSADGKKMGFGIGFHIQDLDGETKIGHGGAVYGFSTQLEALPDRKFGVAAVTSLDGCNGVVRRLANYSLRLMSAAQDGDPLPDYQVTTPIVPERAKQLVGTYREVDGDGFARISELDGDVFLRQGAYRYQLGATDDPQTFLTDDRVGFGTEVRRQSSDRIEIGSSAYQRVPDVPPRSIPDRWRGLIGEYGWDHNTLYILEDNGKLYALIEWFYYYPLTEIDDNTFEFPDHGLYHGEGLKFSRGDDGVATSVVAAEVKFDRREVGTKDGETFKITPVHPIDDLRAAALAASPPAETGEYRDADLVELTSLDPTIKLDIRYATTNNFTGAVFYQQSKAFMQRDAAEAVVRAHRRLQSRGLGLLIHDAYRPWHVTKMFWDATPGEFKDFVANPANGSRHNRGCAVDLTLYDLKTGAPIQMVAGYDEFSTRSFPQYPGGTSRQRWFRTLLRETMEAESFSVYQYEWWHFDFKDWKRYRIGNVTFEDITTNPPK